MGRRNCLIGGCLALCLAACGKETPIVIGLVGDIPINEGISDSGLQNGAFQALSEINDKGGVLGRTLKIAVDDDTGDPASVRKADERILAKGAVVLVGHATSATTAAALPIVNAHNVMLMGPDATSSQFAGKQDFFVRTEVTERVLAEALAQYASQALHVRSVGVVLDERNVPFSRPFFEAFRDKLQTLGGKATVVYSYSFPAVSQASSPIEQFLSGGGDSVLLVTGGEDTRRMGQLVRRIRDSVPLLATPWAVPPAGARRMGPLPGNLYFPCTWDPDSQAPAYLSFKTSYEDRFGQPVDYHAVHAYEAVTIAAKGIEETKAKAASIPHAITAIGQFRGLQGPIRIDAFGDCQRDVTIVKVVDGVPHRAPVEKKS